MTSVFSSLFTRDPRNAFQYDISNDSVVNYNGIFIAPSFKKNDPKKKATCFRTNCINSSFKLQIQKLKTLRHPNVLIYLDSLEFEDNIYLITEECKQLEDYFDQNITDTQKELFVSWGFYQILNCLKFLHNEVKISQNNLKESIFITSSGDWKISGFSNTKPFVSPYTDLNDLAFVFWQIFNGFSNTEVNSKSLKKIPKRFQLFYKKLDAKSNISTATDLINEGRTSGGLMKNKFVDTLIFLEEFQLKDFEEKQTFFIHLKDNLELFPEDVLKRKILPKLIHAYEYGDAGSYIIIPMFKLGKLLDEEEYQDRIVPCIVKLFSSTDRATRVKLLDNIDEFGPHLKPEIINESIYSNLVTGFLDTNAAVRESTIKAMVSIAEKLNYNNLNNDLMKYLARIQSGDEQSGIRTNTTICLGKISCYIDPSHRQRILISAFTRALKDPFPPARVAGILSMSATQQYYSLNEVAKKIIPSLASLTVDSEKQVRDQAFKALKGFLENLEKASENPELIPELEAQVKAGGRSELLTNEKVPQWANWALKALSGKFYKSANVQNSTITSQNVESSKNNNNLSKKNETLPLDTKVYDNKKLDENIKQKTIDLFSFSNENQLDNQIIKINENDNLSENVSHQTLENDGWDDNFDFFDASDSFEKAENMSNKKKNSKPSIKSQTLSSNTSTNSSITKIDQSNKTSSATLKLGGPMKLGAKKVTDKALNDLERDLLK